MALAFGVATLVFGDVHDKAGNGSHGGVGSRARAGPVLALLVVGFPTPSQLDARRLAVLRLMQEGFHRVLLDLATECEPGFGSEHPGNGA